MQLIYPKENEPTCQPDPFIFEWKGVYYVYATGQDGVHAYRALALDGEWEYVGMIFTDQNEQNFWAPCVYEEDGVFYLYYSSRSKTSQDIHDEQIRVATSRDPAGKFTYQATLLPPFSIDPHVVKSGDGLYIFYSVNDYEAERAGTYIVVQKMRSPIEVIGDPVAAVKPTLDEEIFARDRFRKGQHWHTIEGACYYRNGDYHYLIYSGNCFESPYYFLGYAVAHSTETDLTKLRFEKHPAPNVYAPLIAANGFESGTGHNSTIDINGETYCVYHGRDLNDVQPYDNRTARACKLIPCNGTLTAIRKKDAL